VQRIRQYIRQGDVYQVNLSQRFTAPFQGDPFPLFRCLFERNPAPFYAYIRAGDHQIVSTSMERFLALRDGIIESRPI
jgi:para-aminobenzoate synthetase component 1